MDRQDRSLYCLAYPDHIIILGKDFEHHSQMIQEVSRRLHQANLKLHRRLRHLEHLLAPERILTSTDNIYAIQQNAAPTNLEAFDAF